MAPTAWKTWATSGLYGSELPARISLSSLNYSYKDLKKATCSFSVENKIGQGSNGTVYKVYTWIFFFGAKMLCLARLQSSCYSGVVIISHTGCSSWWEWSRCKEIVPEHKTVCRSVLQWSWCDKPSASQKFGEIAWMQCRWPGKLLDIWISLQQELRSVHIR